MIPPDRPEWRPRALVVGLVWGLAALPFAAGIVRCPTAQLLHVPCPGCGMTRALGLLAAGDVPASLAMHPLALPTALAHGLLAVASIGATLRFGEPWALLSSARGRAAVGLAGGVLVLDVLVWIARALGALGGPVPV